MIPELTTYELNITRVSSSCLDLRSAAQALGIHCEPPHVLLFEEAQLPSFTTPLPSGFVNFLANIHQKPDIQPEVIYRKYFGLELIIGSQLLVCIGSYLCLNSLCCSQATSEALCFLAAEVHSLCQKFAVDVSAEKAHYFYVVVILRI